MIRSIVFDLGNVLVRFAPEQHIRPYVDSDAEALAVRDMIYLSEPWKDGDHGRATRGEVIEGICGLYPDRQALLRRVLAGCSQILSMPEGTPSLLDALWHAGLSLYYLSNTNPEDYAYMMASHPPLGRMQGIASFREGVTKPDPAIFRLLLDRYGLDPAQCLFIDDMPANTRAAAALGFHTITLACADALGERLRQEAWIRELLEEA